MRRRIGVVPALLLLSAPTCLSAQPVPAQVAESVEHPAAAVAAIPDLPCERCIPALAPVDLVIDTDLGSKISKTGETFAFHLARPIVIDGHELVPAGTPGQGEVIHAKKAGGSGTAGELVLAARYLPVGSQRLRLRSMHVAQRSEDAIGKIDAFNAATVMSPVPVALVGFAITGRNNVFPKGTPAIAKTAELFTVPSPDGGAATADASTRLATPPVGPEEERKQDDQGSNKGGTDPVGGGHDGDVGPRR